MWVPWTARRSSQSILKEISSEYSLEGMILKLKLQYFGHLMWRTDSFENTLMLGKTEGRRRRGLQRMRWLDGIYDSVKWVWVNSGSWWWTGRPGMLQPVGSQRVRQLSDWTELNWCALFSIYSFDLLEVQGNLKSLLQPHSSKASILWYSALSIVQPSHPYMTTGKIIALTSQSLLAK